METLQTPGALAAFVKSRLGHILGELDEFRPEVRRRVKGLKSLQKKHAVLEAQLQEEIRALEKKYLDLYTPLYQKRSEIIKGLTEPTDEEVLDGGSEDGVVGDDEEDEEEGDKKDVEKVAGIPEFWLTSLNTFPVLAEGITDKDEAALKHLIDVRMSYLDTPGYRLEFEFSPNEYFFNTLLTKTYYYQDEPGYGGEYVYDRAEGTKIDWKEGKDLSVTIESRKQRHKGTNKTRIVKKTVPAETFFSFFSPPVPPKKADGEDEDEEHDEVLERLEHDFTMGEEIKDSLIPHAVDWFTGKALEGQNDFDMYDDDFDYEDDEDDEDDDINDEDSDEESDGDGIIAKDAKAPECKQQ
ncbi:hypothetical protein BGZ94_010206 [Podila epigama]|nr:hypothetical protein BGZ94_010206 [Podila epigama]